MQRGGTVPARSYRVPYPRRGSVVGEAEVGVLARLLESPESLSQGYWRDEFETKFKTHLRVPHALSVTSGTVALEIAIRLLDLHRGDEVIVTPQSYKATIQPLLNHEATVRFCDIDPNSLNLDLDCLESLITGRTKAIILVHYGGLPCDMDAVMAMARGAGITVIEDCAHALGAVHHGRRPGALADIGCFSFHSSKNITTLGEGGMITLHRDDLAARVDRLRSNDADAVYHEAIQPIGGRTSAPDWMMHPGLSYTHACSAIRYGGTNATLAEPSAAVGTVQLARLDTLIGRRQSIAERLTGLLDGFPGVTTQSVPRGLSHAYHLYTFFVDPSAGIDRDRLVARLEALGVEMQLRYFPLHLLAEWRARGHGLGECPTAERLWFSRQVNLPCQPGLTDEQVDHLLDALGTALTEALTPVQKVVCDA